MNFIQRTDVVIVWVFRNSGLYISVIKSLLNWEKMGG